jgi:choline-sulfatase
VDGAGRVFCSGLLVALTACGRQSPPPDTAPPTAAVPRHVVLVTVDTLRADRVGAYGFVGARTPVIDALAASGLLATAAYSTAPVTLPSHASILTGRYPPAHGARHNGMVMGDGVPTLATVLKSAGFATGAFVSAFPLDRRFGLGAGFDVYGDRWARGHDGHPTDERAGALTVDEALAWRRTTGAARTFLWVHLFEPHAPYGDVSSGRPVRDRYDDEIAEADRQVGRLLEGLGPDRSATLVVLTADHGEAFGEHGETGHSLFVYDTTLQVPLIFQGPRALHGRLTEPVSLVDVAPTVLAWLDVPGPAMDGQVIPLGPGLQPAGTSRRTLYAETEAPFVDFGWSPLRSARVGPTKFILAPTPELYDLAADAGETTNLVSTRPADARRLASAISVVTARGAPTQDAALTPESRRRLQALGYLGGAGHGTGGPLADPKDRRELAARMAQVTSGELTGPDLERALAAIVRDDPGNPQARLRLGYALVTGNRCPAAETHFRAAIARRMPTADAHLGLAGCLAARRAFRDAERVLDEAAEAEPGNPSVLANQGIVRSDAGRPADAVPYLRRALALDAEFHQARFALAIALARTADRAGAEAEALELLRRLPAGAPQRSEVERLRSALR